MNSLEQSATLDRRSPASGLLGVGQKVWTTVSVNGITQRMASGIITAVHSGYCEVDVMSLHGGAPWVQYHNTHSLELETTPSAAGEPPATKTQQ